MSSIWSHMHQQMYPGHRTTDTDCEDCEDCEDCGARLPMHVAGEGER